MAMDEALTERKLTILKAIIQNYLETGEPVGSRTLSKYTDLKLSSATFAMRWRILRILDIFSSHILLQGGYRRIKAIGSMWIC